MTSQLSAYTIAKGFAAHGSQSALCTLRRLVLAEPMAAVHLLELYGL
jgi:hypothetical protein